MASNPDKLDYIFETTTPGKEGFKHDGQLFGEAKWANRNSAALLNRFTPGQSGVRHDGDLFAMLRRTEAQTAVIPQLVKALANVSGGETFDEAKLLAGISKAVFDNAKAGAEAGVANAVESIDTTVTIKQEAAK